MYIVVVQCMYGVVFGCCTLLTVGISASQSAVEQGTCGISKRAIY